MDDIDKTVGHAFPSNRGDDNLKSDGGHGQGDAIAIITAISEDGNMWRVSCITPQAVGDEDSNSLPNAVLGLGDATMTKAEIGDVDVKREAEAVSRSAQISTLPKPASDSVPSAGGKPDQGNSGKNTSSGDLGAPAAPKSIFFDDAVLKPTADDPLGIDLKTHHPRVPRTPEAHNLLKDIFAVEHVIRILFYEAKYKGQRKQFFEGLLMTTKAGLCGDDYDIETGRLDLGLTQDEIADAFPMLRDALWKNYFSIVALSTSVFGILGCLIYYHFIVRHAFADHNKTLLDAVPALPQIVLALVWIPAAVPIGIFLEFVFRVGENLSYESLLAINPGRWKPWRRTASTLVTAYVFAFIIGVGAFQIGIAGILLNDFVSARPWLSLAIGFVTGFTFPYVRDIVTQFKPERRDASPHNRGASSLATNDKSK